MNQQWEKDDLLLELIPEERMTQRQKALKRSRNLPMYQFRREPTHFNGLDGKEYGELTVWRDNRTLIYIGKGASDLFRGLKVFFSIYRFQQFSIEGAIYGGFHADDDDDDDDFSENSESFETVSEKMAETATFFWSLQDTGERASRLEVDACPFECDFAAFTPTRLAQILDANPTRYFDFDTGIWTAEQSVVLATRPYPFNLIKPGTAFVDALDQRQPAYFFGSLWLYFLNPSEVPFSPANLQRLWKLDVSFDNVELCAIDSTCVLFPFSVQAKALDYKIHVCDVQPSDFDTLDIRAKDLLLKVCAHDDDNWDELVISFLNRVAELGHFKRLGFSTGSFEMGFLDNVTMELLVPVTNALIRAIHANPKLSYLDLSNPAFEFPLDWGPHVQGIFKAMESHSGMREVLLEEYPLEYDSDYSWPKQLLLRNRDITVADRSGKKFTDGSSIDKLYELNHLYKESIKLVNESSSWRPLLVATALLDRASKQFPHTALLMSQHTDVLCELIRGLNLVETIAAQSVPREANVSGPVPHDSGESAPSKTTKLE